MSTLMKVSAGLPSNSQLIPGGTMPSGTSYVLDGSGQILANDADVSLLLSIGFQIVGVAGLLTSNNFQSEISALQALVPINSAKISLTSAQLKALFSSPQTVIPAPGANKAIILLGSVYELVYGTVTYTTTDNTVGLYYGTASGPAADTIASESTKFAFLQTASAISHGGGFSASGHTNLIANEPIVLASAAANMAAGDGTGSVTAFFTTIGV